MNDIYSPFKAAHHLERIAKLRKKELIWPTQVQVDLTSQCNHRCPYCFYRCARNETLNALFDEKDTLPTETVMTLLEDFLECGKPAVQFTGGGEPMKHPDIYKILQKTIDLGLDFSMITNGTMADMSRIEMFRNADWIRISIDGVTPETYAKSQGADPSDFHKAVDFVKALIALGGKTVIGLSFVVNPINYREIFSFAEFARDLGVDNVRFSVAYTPRGIDIFRSIWDEIETLSRKARHLANDKFRIFDLAKEHLCNLDMRDKGYSFCGYQHFTAVIGADQEMYPCCTLKYNRKGSLGNLKSGSFKSLWTGHARKRWLEIDHLKYVCDKNPCWMDSKNSFISYLIQKDPPHVKYI